MLIVIVMFVLLPAWRINFFITTMVSLVKWPQLGENLHDEADWLLNTRLSSQRFTLFPH